MLAQCALLAMPKPLDLSTTQDTGDCQDNPTFYNDTGLSALCEAQPQDACHWFKRAFVLAPDQLGLLVNLGLALHQCGDASAAERSYALASHRPDCRGSALKNLGFLKLWQGEPHIGWELHHQRFQNPELMARHWTGESLSSPLLVWNDVGQGDALQFSRFLFTLQQRGIDVSFAVQQSLVPFFRQTLPADIQLVDRDTAPWSTALHHLPLMGLIRLLDPGLNWSVDCSHPYLRPSLRSSPLPRSSKPRLGLCWASNPADPSLYRSKSMPLEFLMEHPKWRAMLTRVELVSLQRGQQAERLRWAHRFTALLPDTAGWLETACWIESCDLVLSVDTAVAHLAGGMGKPVLVLLPWIHDWRWRYGQQGQRWYSHCWTAPQPGSGNWSGALDLTLTVAEQAGLLPVVA